jgi:hypothetical protein
LYNVVFEAVSVILRFCTVTTHCALEPDLLFAVIVTFPSAFGVTTPLLFTVAIVLSELVKDTDFWQVGFRVKVLSVKTVAVEGDIETVALATVSLPVIVFLPAVTVIVTVPVLIPVTTPFEFTVAIDLSELLKLADLPVVFVSLYVEV